MSRPNSRNRPSENIGDGTAASVDTQFLSKLITSGDTGYLDSLVGTTSSLSNALGKSNRSRSSSRDRTQPKNSKRWPFVLLGMVLAYLILLLWQTRITSKFWETYKTDLKATQQVAVAKPLYDYSKSASNTASEGGLRSSYSGANSNNEHTMEQQKHRTTMSDSSSSSLYKTPHWEQKENNFVHSNNRISYEDNAMGGQQAAVRGAMSQRAKYENVQTGDLSHSYGSNTGNTNYNVDSTSSTMHTIDHPQSNNLLGGTTVTVDNQNFNHNQNNYDYQNNNNSNNFVTTPSYNNNNDRMSYTGNNFAHTNNKNNELSPPSLFDENRRSSSFSSNTVGMQQQQQQGSVVSV
eukprot:CAMPEP_0194242444 /NCGR_PEP_ID=MMETSP0158-20130606/7969_1 /TAXON_ID=33649 /ORGANISM="Thalassionema nitzschioides, Strain L26-B" /LENGTH=348 /DNA_ID=CAMNT_0038977521 /DNA_START=70 /DNA_END=1116 /DNA_ORIENTATION=-